MLTIPLLEIGNFAFPEADGYVIGVEQIEIQSIHLLDRLVRSFDHFHVEPFVPLIEQVHLFLGFVCRHLVVLITTNLHPNLEILVFGKVHTRANL